MNTVRVAKIYCYNNNGINKEQGINSSNYKTNGKRKPTYLKSIEQEHSIQLAKTWTYTFIPSHILYIQFPIIIEGHKNVCSIDVILSIK